MRDKAIDKILIIHNIENKTKVQLWIWLSHTEL